MPDRVAVKCNNAPKREWIFWINSAGNSSSFNNNFPVLTCSLPLWFFPSFSVAVRRGYTLRRKCNCSSNSDDAGVIRIARANVLDSVSAFQFRAYTAAFETLMPDTRTRDALCSRLIKSSHRQIEIFQVYAHHIVYTRACFLQTDDRYRREIGRDYFFFHFDI